MKRIVALIVGLSLVAVACSSSAEIENDTDYDTTVTTPDTTVATEERLAYVDESNPVWKYCIDPDTATQIIDYIASQVTTDDSYSLFIVRQININGDEGYGAGIYMGRYDSFTPSSWGNTMSLGDALCFLIANMVDRFQIFVEDEALWRENITMPWLEIFDTAPYIANSRWPSFQKIYFSDLGKVRYGRYLLTVEYETKVRGERMTVEFSGTASPPSTDDLILLVEKAKTELEAHVARIEKLVNTLREQNED